jgi:hypothetical protein
MNTGKIWRGVILSAILTISLAACQPTPKEEAIKQKGNLDQVIQSNESEASDQMIKEMVKAEDTRNFEVKSPDSKLTVKVDAKVIIPDVTNAQIYQVIRNDFTDEDVVRICKAFYGDSDLYPEVTYKNMTKDELLQEIADVQKQYEDVDPEYKEAVQSKLNAITDMLQSYIKNAPETIKREPYKELKLEKDDDISAIGEYQSFSAKGKLGDQNAHISFQVSDGYTGVYFYKEDPEGLANFTRTNIISMEGKDAADMENTCKYSVEEAVALTEDVMKQLGLDQDYAYYSVEDAARGTRGGGAVSNYTGYQIIYTRTIGGIQETDDIYNGTFTEDEAMDTFPYGSEKMAFIVMDQGVMQFYWDSPMKLGAKQADNVALKEYTEIENIFKNHILIKFADADENAKGEELPSVINVNEIRFGYMRVKNKNKQDEFTMVPAWDFISDLYGKSSILTVNAIDGSVLDRRYGY